jgi:hypothetical protein
VRRNSLIHLEQHGRTILLSLLLVKLNHGHEEWPDATRYSEKNILSSLQQSRARKTTLEQRVYYSLWEITDVQFAGLEIAIFNRLVLVLSVLQTS